MLPGVGSDFGRYRISGRLGRGGMGVVFSAVHRDLDRPVALKLLTPDLSDDDSYRHRFLREARILARLDSPHIVRVYDAGEQDGWLYIATQLIDGGDLKQVLDTTGPLPLVAALELVAQIAEGLSEAHEAGILHRDIKPSNVLLRQRSDGRRQAILCDLGIATVAGSDSTLTVGVIGTPTYMAPERHQGEDATVASDVYALGCLLWATMTGGPPYQGTSAEIFRGHVHGAIPQLPDHVPHAAAINEVVSRAMAKDPVDRYPTVAALVGAVRTIDPSAFRGSYREDTIDHTLTPEAEGTIIVPYVESTGVGPLVPDAGFVGADAVPSAESSIQPPPAPAFEPSVELPPPTADTSVDLPPPAGHEPSDDASVEASLEPSLEEDEPADTVSPEGGRLESPAAPPVVAPATALADPELTNARPPGSPPPPPPPPGTFAPVPAPARKEPSRGRGKAVALVGAVALAVAAVVGAIFVVVSPGSDDRPEAKDTKAAAGSSTTTEPSGSESAPPPPVPDAPKVSATPDYRSVVFTVSAAKSPPGFDLRFERRDGKKWVAVDREFDLKTPEGGDRACALVRASLTGEGGTTSSHPTRACTRSEPKTLRVVESKTRSCGDFVSQGVVFECHVYAVEISGFPNGSTPYMEIIPEGDTNPCETGCRKPIPIDAHGRGRLEDGVAAAYRTNEMTIRVASLEYDLVVP